MSIKKYVYRISCIKHGMCTDTNATHTHTHTHTPCKSFTKHLYKIFINKHIYLYNGHGLVWSHRSIELVVRI